MRQLTLYPLWPTNKFLLERLNTLQFFPDVLLHEMQVLIFTLECFSLDCIALQELCDEWVLQHYGCKRCVVLICISLVDNQHIENNILLGMLVEYLPI